MAITAVVGIHTGRSDFNYDSVIGFLTVSLRQIIGCAVPIFLAISGYFLCQKKIKNKVQYFHFLKRQIPTVYIPCLIWSLPWLLIAIKEGQSLMVSFLFYFVCGLSIMYFIAVIIQCYIGLPLFGKVNKKGVFIFLFISLLASAVNSIYNIIPGTNLPLIIYGGPIPMLGVFFVIGCWLGQKPRVYNIQLAFILYIVTLLFAIVDTYYQHANFGILALGLKTTTQLNSFFAVLLLFHPYIKN